MSTTYVALLRGINVGKNKRIAMARLRELLTDLGYQDVRTLLQSGNAVVTADARSAAAVRTAIEERIVEDLGMQVPVVIRTGPQLLEAAAGNPFADVIDDGARAHVVFVDGPARLPKGFDAEAFAPERVAVRGSAVYLWLPGGTQSSRLLPALDDRQLGGTATMRNWNTVTKLAAMLR